jgi:hypothetical protein
MTKFLIFFQQTNLQYIERYIHSRKLGGKAFGEHALLSVIRKIQFWNRNFLKMLVMLIYRNPFQYCINLRDTHLNRSTENSVLFIAVGLCNDMQWQHDLFSSCSLSTQALSHEMLLYGQNSAVMNFHAGPYHVW